MAISAQQQHPQSKHDRHRSTKQPLCSEDRDASKSVMRVCFSFAAYAKSLIDHLTTNCHVPVHEGLSDDEFREIEAALRFKFPPDLRSILREGLLVGAGFPNWRAASKQQLQLLINLPILEVCKSVRDGGFWMNAWGVKPGEKKHAVAEAERRMREASPAMIPIYKRFYIPAYPNLTGNPVFEVDGGEVRAAGFDIAGFFEHRAEFSDLRVKAPAWKATEARRIGTWTALAADGRGGSGGWWWWSGGKCGGEFGRQLEDAFWRLRDGGWDVDEVSQMMRMDGYDCADRGVMDGRDGCNGFKKRLSEILIKGGWCHDDVVYSLDLKKGKTLKGMTNYHRLPRYSSNSQI
uniref:Knr4/Smi1-like domain-containing protein n=1 Tax=Kalanchoe fedtschenkoi TaxID=63787 RepID=A0A7N0TMC5_KALFE